MPDRFSLRIESGDRAGETVSLSGRGLTVGRRPANDLALQDSSVSGRHARLSIEDGQVLLIDFGSTNGTFVGGERVEEHDLKHGDELRFGKIEVLFLDAEAGPAPAPAAPAAPPAVAVMPAAADDDFEVEIDFDDDDDLAIEEPAAVPAMSAPAPSQAEPAVSFGDIDDDGDNEVHQIDAAALAKASGGRGPLPLLLAVVVVAGGAGWYFAGMPGLAGDADTAGTQSAAREVATTPGNLLADASFESEGESDWTASDTAPVMPWVAASWRTTGKVGMGADLEAGQWGLVRSADVKLGHKRGLTATASAFAEDGAQVEIGLALSDSTGEHPSTIAWSAPGQGDVDSLSLSLTAAPGYDTARVLLRASADGNAGAGAFDDVALVAGAATGAVSFGDFTSASSGTDRAVLYHIDRPLLLDLGVIGKTTTIAPTENGMSLSASPGAWSVVVDPELLAQGMATLGQAGYRPHADAFEDAGVTSVVLGRRAHQLRLLFAEPVTLKGTPLSIGYKLEATLSSGDIALELSFSGQRSEAARLNSEAKNAAATGDRGKAVRSWQQLLNNVPFDYDLVAEAEAGRALMVSAGLVDLLALRGDFERASFFALPELFAACLASARELEAEFEGSEVAEASRLFAENVENKLVALTGTSTSDDERVRAAILGYLEQAGHTSLAARLRTSLLGTNNAE